MLKRRVDYNQISHIYDEVRQADVDLLNRFLQEVKFRPMLRVLDIGCGTGNHAHALQKLTRVQVYGLEPAEGMLSKARQKNQAVTWRLGSAEAIPFEANTFDFIYMTDVIHHVPDIRQMFAEIYRVLNIGGKACVVTQSHQQIARRPIARFFPGTIAVDWSRYPDIDRIIAAATGAKMTLVKTEIIESKELELGAEFLELVRKKGYSMLHLVGADEYERGLQVLEIALQKGKLKVQSAGTTLVWVTKQ